MSPTTPPRAPRLAATLRAAVASAVSAATLASPAMALQNAPRPSDVPDDPFAVAAQRPAAPGNDDPFAVARPAPAVVPVEQDDAPPPDVRYDRLSETVDIRVSDADLSDVLRMLSSQSRRNIVAGPEVTGKVTCSLFGVTVEQALEAILRGNGFVAREEGDFIYVYGQQQLADLQAAQRRQETRVFRLYHVTAESAATLVAPSLSESATVSFSAPAEAGVGSSREDAGGQAHSGTDRLIIRDFPENLDEIAGVLQEIDQRPEQVLIEATILSTKLTETNSFGVDFNVVGGVDFNSFTSQGPQITGGGIADAADNPYSVGTGNSFSGPVNGGLKLGLVTNNVSAFVAALEGITDTTVLANPKVLALNKQRGEVLVGREDGYLTTTLTETTATQEVQFLSTGTRLIFRPFISRDGYVRLEIHPEDSQGGLNASNLPFKTTTEVTSNVLVKDGRTIVIGGLFRESATIGRSQIPILGNLPILGAAFRRQSDATVREEIIILLTPHIVKDLDRYSSLSEQELKRAEKMRVGQRKGMMAFGRERMAQLNYERAVRSLDGDKPNRGRALFFLNAALGLDPTFIEAVELKERVTGKVVVEADQSSVRGFVRRAAVDDFRGPGPLPPYRKPDADPLLVFPQDKLQAKPTRPERPGFSDAGDVPAAGREMDATVPWVTVSPTRAEQLADAGVVPTTRPAEADEVPAPLPPTFAAVSVPTTRPARRPALLADLPGVLRPLPDLPGVGATADISE